MKCWICGAEGDSGEHLLKASDIKSLFSDISQKNPIYYSTDEHKNKRVGSSKSNIFKSDALICQDCNNNKTSEHDKSWEQLSAHLRGFDLFKRGRLNVRLNKVFKQDIYKNSLYVHLYFVKLFGCRIIEESVPIDTKSFSEAILLNKPNPYVFLVFKKAIGSRLITGALTPIHLEMNDGTVIVSAWMYTVGDLNIEILYSPAGAATPFLKNSFHPNCRNRLISFQDFEYEKREI